MKVMCRHLNNAVEVWNCECLSAILDSSPCGKRLRKSRDLLMKARQDDRSSLSPRRGKWVCLKCYLFRGLAANRFAYKNENAWALYNKCSTFEFNTGTMQIFMNTILILGIVDTCLFITKFSLTIGFCMLAFFLDCLLLENIVEKRN